MVLIKFLIWGQFLVASAISGFTFSFLSRAVCSRMASRSSGSVLDPAGIAAIISPGGAPDRDISILNICCREDDTCRARMLMFLIGTLSRNIWNLILITPRTEKREHPALQPAYGNSFDDDVIQLKINNHLNKINSTVIIQYWGGRWWCKKTRLSWLVTTIEGIQFLFYF